MNRFSDASVADAGPDAPPLDMIPDVTGDFLLAESVNIAPDQPLQFIMTNTLTQNGDGTATLDSTFTPLRVSNRMPVGTPIVANGVQVSQTGSFTIQSDNVMIPGAANPITGSDIVANIVMTGTIKSTDRLCGDLTGMVLSPIMQDLAGSTFSAIRVAPGTIGSALPPPEYMCPAETPDAGVPDASTPDAAVPDAGAPDAV